MDMVFGEATEARSIQNIVPFTKGRFNGHQIEFHVNFEMCRAAESNGDRRAVTADQYR